MQISKNLAQTIVENLKDIINQNLNFIDNEGKIIASTDPKRINTYHEAALHCIKLNKIIVIEYDNQYIGSLKGINLPVTFDRKVIGVIGVTGELNEVEKYGTVIKKMTEILLREGWIKDNISRNRDYTRHLINSAINNGLKEFEYIPDNLINNAKYFIVARPNNSIPDVQSTLAYKNTDKILKIFENNFIHDNVYATILNDQIIIISIDNNKISLLEKIKRLNNYLNNLFEGFNFSFGISQNFIELYETKTFYRQAVDASYWNNNFGIKENIIFYEDMDLGILLTNISNHNKVDFSKKILKNLNDMEITFYEKLINVYGLYNGSITQMSEHLFLHKNTIQYRLNKLYELTTYNPRNYNDYVILKLAFVLKNSI